MSNRINSMHHVGLDKTDQKVSKSGGQAVVKPGDATKAGKTAGNTAVADTVALTDRVQLLGRLEQAIASVPELDRTRVEAVKKDIANGNYEIDIENIVDIMLQSEQDFGS